MNRLHLITRPLFICGFLYLVWLASVQLSAYFAPPASSLPAPSLTPVFRSDTPPGISAKHVFVLDRKSKSVLYKKNADDQIYPASTTKMMTAVVVHEKLPVDSIITVQKAYPEGVDIGLVPGEQLPVSDLLYALLVQSANDAAEVLADGYPGGRENFIAAMNQKVQDLHLLHTHFLNPTGLDQEGHYSSAADLTRIADHLLSSPYLAKIVSTENAVVSSADFSSHHPLSNVNQLLGQVYGVQGIKTGFTDLAGESLITLVNREGHEVVISLLGSTDRFTDTKLLIDWIYSSFDWTY